MKLIGIKKKEDCLTIRRALTFTINRSNKIQITKVPTDWITFLKLLSPELLLFPELGLNLCFINHLCRKLIYTVKQKVFHWETRKEKIIATSDQFNILLSYENITETTEKHFYLCPITSKQIRSKSLVKQIQTAVLCLKMSYRLKKKTTKKNIQIIITI